MTKYFVYSNGRSISVLKQDHPDRNQLVLIAENLTTYGNAEILIQALEGEDDRKKRREEEDEAAIRYLTGHPHVYEQDFESEDAHCKCGKEFRNELHIVSTSHIHPFIDGGAAGICRCGKTRHSPIHEPTKVS